jgi:hypothetical protein
MPSWNVHTNSTSTPGSVASPAAVPCSIAGRPGLSKGGAGGTYSTTRVPTMPSASWYLQKMR